MKLNSVSHMSVLLTMYKEHHMINASKDHLKIVMQMLNGIDYALKFIITSHIDIIHGVCVVYLYDTTK